MACLVEADHKGEMHVIANGGCNYRKAVHLSCDLRGTPSGIFLESSHRRESFGLPPTRTCNLWDPLLFGFPEIEISAPEIVGPRIPDVLCHLGRFLGKLHSKRFHHTGPLLRGGPPPLQPGDYHFLSWSRQGMENWWRETCEADDTQLVATTRAARHAFVHSQIPRAVEEMAAPRFVHGDCPAHQFFCDPAQGHVITGVIDLECAQSSERGPDFAKLFIELVGHFSPRTDWLDPFWEGYGAVYDFDLLRLHLLLFQDLNFKCLGMRSWPGDRQAIVSHILKSRDYPSLSRWARHSVQPTNRPQQ